MTKKDEKTIKSLLQFLNHEIKDLYNAEHQILETLPKLIKAATNKDLKQALKDHLKETKHQVKRLETVFELLGKKPKQQHCSGIEGILKEGDEMVEEPADSTLRDAAIIAAAQKVEHYEITSYGTARAHAKELDLAEIAALLKETLDEEAAADKKLTKIAEGSFFAAGVNRQALEADTYSMA